MTDVDALRLRILADQRASYARLRGGFPIPIAGAIYWGALAWAGTVLSPRDWILAAMYGSGLIFPLALLLARIFRNDFMRDKTATGGVLVPTFIAMLLFWPMLIAALNVAASLVPLILAIGMSQHWPVIGWSYGRTALFTAHAVVRAIVVLLIWAWLPEGRYTLLPLSVSIVYLVTVAAIVIDSSRMQRTRAAP